MNQKFTQIGRHLSSSHNYSTIFNVCHFQVHELLQQALQNLPDSSEAEAKLMIPTEAFEDMDTTSNIKKESDTVDILDRLMCDIVDKL